MKQPYHNIQEVEQPPSLRYTFVEPLQSYEDIPQSNHPIAALLYQDSILVENLDAEPFPYCEDDRVLNKIKRTSYFVEASPYTNLRRIEDLVVLYFDPKLHQFPSRHSDYDVWLRLHKQFNWLYKQAREFKRTYCARVLDNQDFQELFQNDPDQPYTQVFARIFHQIELETQRYIILNKYHLIQNIHLHNLRISYSTLYWTDHVPEPDIDARYLISDDWIHQDDTEFSRYIFDYYRDPDARSIVCPAWELEQVTDKGWDREYPFAPFGGPRTPLWIYGTCPIATRHRYTDLDFDPEYRRYGRVLRQLVFH